MNGNLRPGVYAKDVILHIIRLLGANGGIGYAYEYAGDVFERMSMEERMTVCNMSIEGGARCGYVNPDSKTVAYLQGRPYVDNDNFDETAARWLSFASDADAHFDDVVKIDAAEIEPTVTWGISPDAGISITENIPDPLTAESPEQKASIEEALAYMKLPAGAPSRGSRWMSLSSVPAPTGASRISAKSPNTSRATRSPPTSRPSPSRDPRSSPSSASRKACRKYSVRRASNGAPRDAPCASR